MQIQHDVFLRAFFCALLISSCFLPTAKADWVLLPDSHHNQYQTHGLFIDQQSNLLLREAGKAYGGIAGTIAVAEFSDLRFKPQLILHGGAEAAFQLNSSGNTLLTQTVDARVGLSLDFSFTESFRGAIIWTHQSGHISDDVPDKDLIGSNLGNEIINFRLIRDFDQRFRVGGGIRPTVGSDPGMIAFGAEQFAEWWFTEQKPHSFAPYLAVGFEEYGRHAIQLSSHVQLGVAAGSHFLPHKLPSLRLVLGYYNGNDPRLKYYQFKNSRTGFFYGGLMFDL